MRRSYLKGEKIMRSHALKVLHTAVAAVVCFWPVWYYLIMRYQYAPDGIKEEAVLFCCSFALFSFIQLVFFVVFRAWLMSIWKK